MHRMFDINRYGVAHVRQFLQAFSWCASFDKACHTLGSYTHICSHNGDEQRSASDFPILAARLLCHSQVGRAHYVRLNVFVPCRVKLEPGEVLTEFGVKKEPGIKTEPP